MILTKEEFLNYGFKVSADSSAELAIKECELFHVKSALTDEVYLRCQEESEDMEIIREGGNLNGKVYAGLKFAIAHLSFAYLLRQNVAATRMGSVLKDSEYSSQVDSATLFEVMNFNISIGNAALREVCEYFQLDTDRVTNNAFGLLL